MGKISVREPMELLEPLEPYKKDTMDKNFGLVSKKVDGFQVRFERSLPFKAEVVWDAITDPEKLAIWFTDIEMDFKEGGKMIIRFRDEARTESFGKIIRIDPPKVFEYTWEDELARWEVIPDGPSHCTLVLIYSKLPDNYAISVPAGWHIILDQLETVLNGRREPYPFGGHETQEGKQMKALYAAVISKDFPTLKNN